MSLAVHALIDDAVTAIWAPPVSSLNRTVWRACYGDLDLYEMD